MLLVVNAGSSSLKLAGFAADLTQLAEARDESPLLHIEHRELKAVRRAGGVVWFDFRTLCGGPRSQNDYLEIASQFHTVFLSDVPQMAVRMASLNAMLNCSGNSRAAVA